MINNRYSISKSNMIKAYDLRITDGLDISPKNKKNYDGIVVNKVTITKKEFISTILKRKIKRKLELYLKFIIDYIDSGSEDGAPLSEVLNDIKRYQDIINYKYKKYLDSKTSEVLSKKLELIEYELKVKLYTISENLSYVDENSIGGKSR